MLIWHGLGRSAYRAMVEQDPADIVKTAVVMLVSLPVATLAFGCTLRYFGVW